MRADKMYGKVDYIVANGFTQFNNPAVANDVSPYESFAGDNDSYDSNVEFNDVPLEIEFSDASGRSKRTRRTKPAKSGKSGVEKALDYTPVGWIKNATSDEAVSRRENRRKDRQDLKREELKVQKDIADQAIKAQEKDTTLLSQIGLTDNKNLPEVKVEKDNTTRNIVIVGVLAIATIAGVYIYKKYNK
jgi:hypothetical protein